jgi:hypothetical protein
VRTWATGENPDVQFYIVSQWASAANWVAAGLPPPRGDRHGVRARSVPTDADVGPDWTHLSAAGQQKFAGLAWQAFPDEIKQRR